MNKNRYLLIRNIRGNWSMRLLYEFMYRNLDEGKFGYLNLISYEFFPPSKPAPTILKSNFREKLISKLFFENALPATLESSLLTNCLHHNITKRRLFAIRIVFLLLRNNSSTKLQEAHLRGIPFGKFVHTTLIAKYGIKHFNIRPIRFLTNARLFYRFAIGFISTNSAINLHNYSHVVLINGRDATGVGAQLAAYINKIEVICTENPLHKSDHPQYACWNGNMHHWKVREHEMENTLRSSNLTTDLAHEYILEKFSLKSHLWDGQEIKGIPKYLSNRKYVCFFTTSEKETTTCPAGNSRFNFFDSYDQTKILETIYQNIVKTEFLLVIRLHPNFTNSKIARNELNFFKNLTKNWTNLIIIENNDSTNSYDLAKNAHLNFIYRSSIGAELSCMGIQAFHTAPTFWSKLCPDKLVETSEKISTLLLKKGNNVSPKINDYFGFADFYKNHGKKFESLEFESKGFDVKNKRSRKYITFFKKIELDKPKFNWYQFRG